MWIGECMDKNLEAKYSELQLEDFQKLKELFVECVFSYEGWEDVVKQLCRDTEFKCFNLGRIKGCL